MTIEVMHTAKRSSHRPLTMGRLPRIFVLIMAMSHKSRCVIMHQLWLVLSPEEKVAYAWCAPVVTRARQADLCRELIGLPKTRRREIAAAFDRKLDGLCETRFFELTRETDPRNYGCASQ